MPDTLIDPVAMSVDLVTALDHAHITDLRQLVCWTRREAQRKLRVRQTDKAWHELTVAMAENGLAFTGREQPSNVGQGKRLKGTHKPKPKPTPLLTTQEVVPKDIPVLSFKRTVSLAIQAITEPKAREILVVGARGDGKTIGAFGAMLRHAQIHAEQGFPLPTRWMSVRDYHERHRTTTVRSLKNELWHGVWQVTKDDHLATARIGGKVLCEVDLFGIEDKEAMERLKMECHGVHFEEAAPSAVLVDSSGISEAAWIMALTSQRKPTYCHPAIITENYPDEDHWTWQRFVVKQHPGTAYFRIPPGEMASAAQRAEWARATEGRPDLYDRLVAGKPGGLLLGQPVTPEYEEGVHYQRNLPPLPGGDVWIGADFWHHPAVAVALPTSLGQFQFRLARRLDNADIGALCEEILLPWMSANIPLARRIYFTGDPTGETGDQSDRSKSAMRRMQGFLPQAQWIRVSNDPDEREAALKVHLRRKLSTGGPAIALCGPETWELHKALSGGWHKSKSGLVVKSGPEGAHSHVADAAAYVALAFFGSALARGDTLERFKRQSAYQGPWDGQPEPAGTRNPAMSYAQAIGYDAAKWRRQYQD